MIKTGSFLNGVACSAALFLAACTEPADPAATSPVQPAPVSKVVAPSEAPASITTLEAPPAATAQLNPPHGEPGHDCAIPVGAPLDGSENAGNPIGMPTTGAASTSTPVVIPANGTDKLNPAHGEPGHDCAVPVGSPLPG